MTRLTAAEIRERRDEVVRKKGMVLTAYREGRSMSRLADDWEVSTRWLVEQFALWGEPLRPQRGGGLRLIARVLVQGDDGPGVVLVPVAGAATGAQGWRLPGGFVPPGGRIADTAARELLRAAGLARTLTHAVALGEIDGGECHVVCAAAALTAEEAAALAVPGGGAVLVPLDVLDYYVSPREACLVRAAVDAVERGDELPLVTALRRDSGR
ncbi:NUDIX domain-containing protein [Streptomyces sp. NPDC021224]|uniref:NUDIX domain-containing protein n=1 Tax=unclassified Streptomyces TaxID=2593676 RepID=UPI0037920086